MGDVGDVDLEFVVAVGESADGDGVVEVAGGFAVDGDDGELAEIAAVAEFVAGDDGVRLLGFFEHLRRGNGAGRWNLRMMISTSTPKSSSWPRISTTRPRGFCVARASR